MTTYTYKCSNPDCSESKPKTVIKRMTEPAPACVECNEQMEQVYSGCNFALKGDWFGTTGKY